MIIFIDSGAFRAIYDTKDPHFSKAKMLFGDLGNLGAKLVTTDYVVDEVYTGLLTAASYTVAMDFDRTFRMGGIKMEWISQERFAKAQEVFRRYDKDKKWSFTDCTSYVVMKELKIKTIFAFDKNFPEMGFKLL